MAMDFYHILGITSDANLSQIRRAYRLLCQRHHPDRTGATGEINFLRIREAYETLSTPARRADYHRQVASAGQSLSGEGQLPVYPPVDVLEDFATHRPALELLLETILQNFTGRGIPKSQPMQPLNLEIVLSPQEAQRGGRVPVRMPVAQVCPFCGGSGRTGLAECDNCGGGGVEWHTGRVDVAIPSNVIDGAIVSRSLRHLGIGNLYLNVHVRVAATNPSMTQ